MVHPGHTGLARTGATVRLAAREEQEGVDMGRRFAGVAVLALALAVGGCGDDDDGDGGSADDGGSRLEADADALVACLGDADVDAAVDDARAFGVEADHVGVEADDLPSELLKYDTGSGTTTGVDLWVFEDADAAQEWRTAIMLSEEDDEAGWVEGRVVVRWEYPVDREQPQAVAVDDCVAELDG